MRIIQSETPRPLNLLAVGPSGLVAAASNRFGVAGGVDVWDAASGVKRFTHATRSEALAFVHGDQYLLLGEQPIVTILDAATGAKVRPDLQSNWCQLAASGDGSRLLGGDSPIEVGFVSCFAVEEVLDFRRLWAEHRTSHCWFKAFALNHDGSRWTWAEQAETARNRPTLTLSVGDGDTGRQLVSTALDPASPVRQLAFTADGAKLLVRTDDRKVQLFDATTGAAAGELVHPGRPFVTGIAVHPRGPVACARTNGTVTFWNPDTCEQLRTFDWKAGRLVSVAFSPDGSLAAAGTEDGKIVVWDVDV